MDKASDFLQPPLSPPIPEIHYQWISHSQAHECIILSFLKPSEKNLYKYKWKTKHFFKMEIDHLSLPLNKCSCLAGKHAFSVNTWIFSCEPMIPAIVCTLESPAGVLIVPVPHLQRLQSNWFELCHGLGPPF